MSHHIVLGIPEQFECIDRTWDVKWVAYGTLHDEEGNLVYGLTDFENAWIILEEGHPPRALTQTFWHEMGHVLDEAMGIPPDDHDEAKQDLFGKLMSQYSRTNC